MNGLIQLLAGFAVGCWGYTQIPTNPEDGCITLLVGGLLMVSSLGRLLRIEDSLSGSGEVNFEPERTLSGHSSMEKDSPAGPFQGATPLYGSLGERGGELDPEGSLVIQ